MLFASFGYGFRHQHVCLGSAGAHDDSPMAMLRRPLQGKREGTPTPDDEQRMMQQMRAEGLMATPAAGPSAAPAAAGAASAAPLGSGGPPPKDGPGTKRIRREVFLKAADGSWQVGL